MPDGTEYSEERCIDLLQASRHLTLADLLDTVRSDVARFTDKQVLDDDCTMLAVRRLR
jgi:serine phosphatase RsbU (regulator of sigma subunit)